MTCKKITIVSCAAGSLIFVSAMILGLVVRVEAQPGGAESEPEFIDLVGAVRDFRERTAPEGHPDFEVRPAHGFALYQGNIAAALGSDGRPVFEGGGHKVNSDWTDSSGRPICFRLFDAARGDHPGAFGAGDSGGIASAATFESWYRDVPGVNMSQLLTLRLVHQPDGTYVFDDTMDEHYEDLGGFFPIEHALLGNPGGSPDRNFHFTYELHCTFIYQADQNQIFKFIGDDDVWVFINGQMVIDLGGVHSARTQYVELNRLGLQDGRPYPLDFFFAERHRTQSNFRIVTNLALQSVPPPTNSSIWD